MPRISSYRHGVPAWIDVTSADIPASGEFYAGMFGWELGPDMGPDAGGYRIFSKDGARVAGIGAVQGGPPAWTTYVAVDDVDEVAGRAAELGGQLAVPPMDLPNGSGRIAFVVDPTGGFLGLFQAGPNHPGAELVNEPGTSVWSELNTRDTTSAMAFLDPLLGWNTVPMDPEAPDAYRIVMVGGRAVAGVMPMGPEFPEHVPTNWLPYFSVLDAQAAHDRCLELGGHVAMPPFDTPVGVMSVLVDPAGAVFAVGAMVAMDDPNEWPS